MTVDANEHSKEQRLNARLDYIGERIELLLGTVIVLAKLVAGHDDADDAEREMRQAFAAHTAQFNDRMAEIATVARLLRGGSND